MEVKALFQELRTVTPCGWHYRDLHPKCSCEILAGPTQLYWHCKDCRMVLPLEAVGVRQTFVDAPTEHKP